MPSRAKGLLMLSLLWGGLGCGVVKPASEVVDPQGGATATGGNPGALTGGGGQSGSDDSGSGGFTGILPGDNPDADGTGGSGPFSNGSGGQPASGSSGGSGAGATGDGTAATGGATATGSGGLTGSGGAAATGGASSGSGNSSASGGATGIGSGGVTGQSSTGGAPASTGGAPAGTGGSPAGSGGAPAGSGGAAGPPLSPGMVALAAACDAPYMIPNNVSHFNIDVTNVGEAFTVDLPCATATGAVVLSFILTQPELVYADTFGANWDTVLAFGDSCDGTWTTMSAAGTTACNDDGCGMSQSQAIALLGYGQHYLFVGGARGQTGQATVHFQHAQVGSGALAQLPAGSSSLTGTTHGPGAVSLCQASAGENSYWWLTCPSDAGGVMSASTCNVATSYDTVLSLQVPATGALTCADDDPSCGVQSKLAATIPAGAGIYVLTVDGTSGRDVGSYTVTTQRP